MNGLIRLPPLLIRVAFLSQRHFSLGALRAQEKQPPGIVTFTTMEDHQKLIALCAPRMVFISYGVPEKGDAKWLGQQGSYMATAPHSQHIACSAQGLWAYRTTTSKRKCLQLMLESFPDHSLGARMTAVIRAAPICHFLWDGRARSLLNPFLRPCLEKHP